MRRPARLALGLAIALVLSVMSFAAPAVRSAHASTDPNFLKEFSSDGTDWTTTASGTESSQAAPVTSPVQVTRYVKAVQTVTASNWWSIQEFRVFQ